MIKLELYGNYNEFSILMKLVWPIEMLRIPLKVCLGNVVIKVKVKVSVMHFMLKMARKKVILYCHLL